MFESNCKLCSVYSLKFIRTIHYSELSEVVIATCNQCRYKGSEEKYVG